MTEETFWLDPLPPFRLDLTVWALRRRASNQIDRWDGATYTRVLVLDGQPVNVTVSQPRAPTSPLLLVTATSCSPRAHLRASVSRLLQQMLGYATNMRAFADLASHDPTIADLARRFQGLKPPRFPTLFEAFLNAFAYQQVSLEVGLLLLNRLTERYGLPWTDEQGTSAAFPGPEQFVNVSEAHLRDEAARQAGMVSGRRYPVLAVTAPKNDPREAALGNLLLGALGVGARGRWSERKYLLYDLLDQYGVITFFLPIFPAKARNPENEPGCFPLSQKSYV